MKHLAILCLILVLSACSPLQVATPAPTPLAITVTYLPTLQPWVDQLGECASKNPLAALFVLPTNELDQNIQQDEIMLILDPTSEQTAGRYASQVGRDQIVVIVNEANEVSALSAEELRSIFTGLMTSWQEGRIQTIQVWVLPQGDPVRRVFDQVVLQDQLLTSEARLAPDPTAMLEAVSGEVGAIGFLPASYLKSDGSNVSGDVQEVQLEEGVTAALDQPVVAVTQEEPSGIIRSLLVCLQSSTH
ncbi:MAG: hypothetical protein C3F13_07835 [Anaerolineales bacterium]|nr:hypothetical protein [Anaerolineae bacterium]PWB53806.1 MAG: hypothetical protein C3F13_07835 [Anaerolineales bacterium]